MKTIQERLEELTRKISSEEFQKSYGLGNEVDFHIFDYDPEDEYIVRNHIKYLESRKNLKIESFDIYEIIINILKEKGFLEKVFEYEEEKGTSYINKIIYRTLGISTSNDLIVKKICSSLKGDEMIFLYGIGKTYSIVRGHTILNDLKNKVLDQTVIMFYPGKYDGQTLNVFNKQESDNYYRAFRIVGR